MLRARTGQVDDMAWTIIKLVLGSIMIVLALFVSIAVYQGFFPPERQDLADLAVRINYMMHGNTAIFERDNPEVATGNQYARNMMVMGGREDHVLIGFGEGKPYRINVCWGETDLPFATCLKPVTLENPLDKPALCEVSRKDAQNGVVRGSRFILMPGDCQPLKAEKLRIVQIEQPLDYVLLKSIIGTPMVTVRDYRVWEPGRYTSATLYPQLGGNDQYHDLFIRYDNIGKLQFPWQTKKRLGLLYLEYVPADPPIVLITPVTESNQDALRARAEKLGTP